MVNGLGVVGWGVGGIEAEAAMLGQPVSMLIPRVVGFKLSGELPDGATATDLVLTITEQLRQHGVVGKFVEFYGPGVAARPAREPRHDRQHEPRVRLDHRGVPDRRGDIRYLRLTGRPTEQVALVEAYAKEQGLWHDPQAEPTYSERLELDLSTVVPSIAGPEAAPGPGLAHRREGGIPHRAAGLRRARRRPTGHRARPGSRGHLPGERPAAVHR